METGLSDYLLSVDFDANPAPIPNFVSTKLYSPRLRATFVARPHLVDVLTGDPDRQLTAVCAPAGYGKSTLIAQWLVKAALPLAWVSLDSTDNGPRPFFSLVV